MELKDLSEEQVAGLTEDQISKAIDTGELEIPETTQTGLEQADEGAGAEVGVEGKENKEAGAGEEEVKKQEGAGGIEKKEVAERLYAGKYKTTDDLEKSVLATSKALNYNENVLKSVLAIAKQTGKWEDVENIYKELDAAIGRGEKANTPSLSAEADLTKGDQQKPTVTQEEKMQMNAVVIDAAVEDILDGPLGADMVERGIRLPVDFLIDAKATRVFMRELEDEYPAIAMKLERELVAAVNSRSKEAEEIVMSKKESEIQNPKALDEGGRLISEYAKKVGLPALDEAALKTELAELQGSPFSYKDKHGFKILDAKGMLKAYQVKNFDLILKAERLAAEKEARVKIAEDYKKMGRRGYDSISTAGGVGARKVSADVKEVDVSDPTQVALLNEEEIEKLLAGKK